MSLTKEQILNKRLKIKKLTIPEWGGEVFIKEMTAAQRNRIEEQVNKSDGSFSGLRENIALASICDEEGTPLFTEKDLGDLGELSGNALTKIMNTAMEISGFAGDEIAEAAKN